MGVPTDDRRPKQPVPMPRIEVPKVGLVTPGINFIARPCRFGVNPGGILDNSERLWQGKTMPQTYASALLQFQRRARAPLTDLRREISSRETELRELCDEVMQLCKAGWTCCLADSLRAAPDRLGQGQLATGTNQAAKGVRDFRSPEGRGVEK